MPVESLLPPPLRAIVRTGAERQFVEDLYYRPKPKSSGGVIILEDD